MDITVVLVVLSAGLLHAVWNAMTKSLHDQYASFALLNIAIAITSFIMMAFVGLPRSACLGYVVASTLCHLGYEMFLMGAYRRADFAQSYTIARGIAPLLVSIVGFAFANEHVSAEGLVGIVVVVVGIVSLVVRRGDGTVRRFGVYWALATGAAIATYTVVDGLGVRVSHDAFRYGALLFALQSAIWTITVLVRRRRWWPSLPKVAVGMASGVISMAAYLTVLWAQIRAPLGVVSALRETGVLWAAVIGVVIFREGRLRRVVIPALIVVVGVALVSIN
ncbi:MAG: EamA family transporter [Acidimicrobiales bacterium]